ncbi:MAG: HdeD family acid-resistance protein [Chloroflexota bacterium]|nr:HdeD family acid-resistance protein [Chloroflexota bacterium]
MRNLGIDRGMLGLISKYWWVMLLRGVFAIIFGIIAIVWPGLTLLGLIWLFGAYAIGDGAVEIWSGIQNRNRHDRWWVEVLIGLAGIVAGVLVISWPGLSAVALMYLIAAWMLVMGVFQIVYAIRVRKEISNEFWIILSGALSVVLGLYFFVFPGDGAISLVWLIGIYAVFFGVLLVIFSFRAKKGFSG